VIPRHEVDYSKTCIKKLTPKGGDLNSILKLLYHDPLSFHAMEFLVQFR